MLSPQTSLCCVTLVMPRGSLIILEETSDMSPFWLPNGSPRCGSQLQLVTLLGARRDIKGPISHIQGQFSQCYGLQHEK